MVLFSQTQDTKKQQQTNNLVYNSYLPNTNLLKDWSYHLAAINSPNNFGEPIGYLNRSDIYDLIRSDLFKQSTERIQNDFEDGIKADWERYDKKPYQDAKKRAFGMVSFSGLNRSSDLKKEVAKGWKHTGIINLDIDGNGIEKQKELFSVFCAMPVCEAAFKSVSGIHTGDFSANIRIEIPSTHKALKADLKRKLRITEFDLSNGKWIDKLHKGYHKAISFLVEQQTGGKIGTSKDLKRGRYLTHDANIYVNLEAKVFGLNVLYGCLKNIREKGKSEAKQFEGKALNINTSDWVEFCSMFSENEGYTVNDGSKHLYITHFSIAANLLGVDRDMVKMYFENEGFNIGSNCIEYPYTKYDNSFGVWAYKLQNNNRKPDAVINWEAHLSYLLRLKPIRTFLSNEPKILIQAPTGKGKTFAAVRYAFKVYQQTGVPTIITAPLNMITEQQGESSQKDHGMSLPYITAATWKEQVKYINNSPVIFCNYDNLPQLVKHLRLEQGVNDFNLIIDEQHELINGYGYRAATVLGVFDQIPKAKQTIALSATPFLSGFDDFKYIKITDSRPKIKEVLKPVKSLYKGLLGVLMPQVKKVQQLVLINSKKQIRKIEKALTEVGVKVGAIYSEDGMENNAVYQQLKKYGTLPNDIDVFLCSSKIATGVNIKALKDIRLIYCENSLFDGFKTGYNNRLKEQFSGRVRNTEKVTELVIIALDREHYKSKMTAHQFYQSISKQWQKRAQSENEIKNELSENYALPVAQNPLQNEFSEIVNCLCETENGIKVNQLGLMYLALCYEVKNTSPFDFELPLLDNVELSEPHKELFKVAAIEAKQERQDVEGEAYKTYATYETANVGANMVYKNTIDAALKTDIENTFEPVKDLTDTFTSFEHEVNKEVLKAIFKFCKIGFSFGDGHKLTFNDNGTLKSRQKRSKLYTQFCIHLGLNEDNGSRLHKKQRVKYKNIGNALYKAFEAAPSGLTRSEIHATIKPFYRNSLSHYKALELAECFIKLDKPVKKRVEGEQVYFYKMVDVWDLEKLNTEYAVITCPCVPLRKKTPSNDHFFKPQHIENQTVSKSKTKTVAKAKTIGKCPTFLTPKTPVFDLFNQPITV